MDNLMQATFDRQASPAAVRNAFHEGRRREDDAESLVFIVDDDASVRGAVQRLLRSVGLNSEAFESAKAFSQRSLPDVPSCLILDIRLPGLSGLDFQLQLARDGVRLPVVFMTGHGDIPMSVRAMKAGAVDFLTKPCRDQDLLDAVMTAIERDRKRREGLAALRALEQRRLALTDRERRVMSLVAAGLLNKQIAGELGLSEVTVKVHRGSLMRKLNARSVPDLVRMNDLMNGRPFGRGGMAAVPRGAIIQAPPTTGARR